MLERFRIAKQKEIQNLIALDKAGNMPAPFTGLRLSFRNSLLSSKPYGIIAEYKRASPSKGKINFSVTPEEVAVSYAAAGCGAISVLTEEEYFKGDFSFLSRMLEPRLPLLRKDFIFDIHQIDYTASSHASALLLIVRMLDDDQLSSFIEKSLFYGIEPVVEVFDNKDLQRAKMAKARVIQVNNRDLNTLSVDTNISLKLIQQKSADEFWITASGIDKHHQLVQLIKAGFDAALVGSSLMDSKDPGKRLSELLHGKR